MSELTEAPKIDIETHNQLLELAGDNQELRENLDRVRQQFLRLEYENANWMRVLGGSAQENSGPRLDLIKNISSQLREEVAGSALPKRANEARYAYTFGKPFLIRGLDDQQPTKSKRGRKPALQAFFENPSAQRHVFSDEAKSIMHSASSTDGIFLLVGDDATKEVHTIPVHQIANIMTNPDHDDEVWAYLRKWDRTTFNNSTGVQETETVSEWIYTDSFPKSRQRAEKIGEDRVAQGKTIIDAVFNRQSGWSLGVPDLMAGQIWWKKYVTMVAYGEQVTETLAYFAAKVKVNSQPGSNNVGLKIGNAGKEKGQIVTYGAGNEIDVFSTAGKAYDFTSLRIFSSFYAAAVGIPLTDLSADPSAAGASYGSAQALQPGARRLIEARRLYWSDWIRRVLKWATGEDITVTPASIMEEDEYRTVQKHAIAWNTGLYHEDEIRPVIARSTGIQLIHDTAPEGVMLPNNEDSLPRSDIDSDAIDGGTPETAASPDQGRSNSSGGQDAAQKKDLRTDKIQNEDLIQSVGLLEASERLDRIEQMMEQLLNK